MPAPLHSDIEPDTLKFIEERLKNIENAKEAISSRNTQIMELKAEIKHRKVVFDEMQKKIQTYVDMPERMDALKSECKRLRNENDELTTQLAAANEHKAKLKLYINDMNNEIIIRDRQNYVKRFEYWIERIAKVLPALPKAIVISLFTTPGLYWTMLVILGTIITASFIGWGPIIAFLKAFINYFKG